jgi:hypothetical protein
MPEPHDDPLQPVQPPDECLLSPEGPPPDIERPLPIPVIESGDPPKDRVADQFTLSELLWLVAAMAVLMSVIRGIARWMTIGDSPAALAATYATVFGFAALASMIVLAWIPEARRIVTVGLWALLGLYIVTAVATVLMPK